MGETTIDVQCPVCDATITFPRWDHKQSGDHGECEPPCECCDGSCDCIGEGVERICGTCSARVTWDCDGELGWPVVDEDDPAWTREVPHV